MSSLARPRWILNACLATALVVPACKKEEELEVPGTTGSTPVDAPPPVELAPVDHPAQLLPRDTQLLVIGSSLSRAAEVFERERLKGVFSTEYDALSGMMRGALGHDLLDPAAWRDIGLDPDGPLGFAVSDVSTGRIILFASVSDRGKLVGFAREIAGKSEVELIEEPYGSASVVRPKGGSDGALVLRDGIAAFVIEQRRIEGYDMPKIIATMDPNVSLAAQVGYRKATGGLRAAEITAFIDIERMVLQANAEDESRSSGPQGNWAQDELAEAQKSGAPPERLAELEQMAKEEEERQARWRKRDEGERALAELVFSGIEGVGLTATVKRSGPILDGRIVAGEDAFMRRLVDNRQGAPVLTTAMNGKPMWCVSGRVGGEALGELFEAIAGAEGQDYAEFLAEGKKELGIDLQADLVPALGGDAGLCAAFEGTLDGSAKDMSKQIGLGAFVQLTDAAKPKYLMAKMATARGDLGKKMRKRGEGYTVSNPDWRDLYLDAVGDRLVLSTDPKLAARLASGDPGSMPSKITPAAARGAMEIPGTAAGTVIDSGMMGLLFFGTSAMSEPMVFVPGMTQEELEKVPLSGKSKKAKRELEKASKKVHEAEQKRSKAQFDQMMSVIDPIGISVAAAIEDERGFTLTGGQFIRAESMGKVLEGILRSVVDRGSPSLSEEERAALEKAWDAEGEARRAFEEARIEDAERFRAKQAKSGKKG